MFSRKLRIKNNDKLQRYAKMIPHKSERIFLPDAEKNTKYLVENIFAGQGLIQRLFSIGIMPGEIISVVDISAWGPVTIIAKGIKIALGRGVAAKISLKRINEAGDRN